jgi:hypothetical protein
MKIRVRVSSYKKAQVFKKDYVRKNGAFIRFAKTSGNHSMATVELEEGEEFDARGSEYVQGATRWDAAKCQGWAKFRNVGGKLVAFDFDGNEKSLPNWVSCYEVKEAAND